MPPFFPNAFISAHSSSLLLRSLLRRGTKTPGVSVRDLSLNHTLDHTDTAGSMLLCDKDVCVLLARLFAKKRCMHRFHCFVLSLLFILRPFTGRRTSIQRHGPKPRITTRSRQGCTTHVPPRLRLSPHQTAHRRQSRYRPGNRVWQDGECLCRCRLDGCFIRDN